MLVHSKALLLQWHERLTDFLEIEFAEPATSRKTWQEKSVFSHRLLGFNLKHLARSH